MIYDEGAEDGSNEPCPDFINKETFSNLKDLVHRRDLIIQDLPPGYYQNYDEIFSTEGDYILVQYMTQIEEGDDAIDDGDGINLIKIQIWYELELKFPYDKGIEYLNKHQSPQLRKRNNMG